MQTWRRHPMTICSISFWVVAHVQDSIHSALIRLLVLVAFCYEGITRDGEVNKQIIPRMASLFGRQDG